ncbi:MAG: hypothetical protein HKUEN01_22360 [Candidatus Kuenenia stuttgartiensis]|nr:MAG: hypothetical protein HKUEN01_22360 [Candidatus Kuenenia stuttgartiensis]
MFDRFNVLRIHFIIIADCDVERISYVIGRKKKVRDSKGNYGCCISGYIGGAWGMYIIPVCGVIRLDNIKKDKCV